MLLLSLEFLRSPFEIKRFLQSPYFKSNIFVIKYNNGLIIREIARKDNTITFNNRKHIFMDL